jgi:TonB family protein
MLPKIGFTLVLLFVSVAAGQQPCKPQQLTAMIPFDVCKYWPLVTEPGIQAPRVMSDPAPTYPQAAAVIKGNLKGSVTLVLAINENGMVDDVKEAYSSDGKFDQNAIDAVRQWKFAPATKDGKAVAAQMKVEITFQAH